jgi:Ankyrin repeats (many copies)
MKNFEQIYYDNRENSNLFQSLKDGIINGCPTPDINFLWNYLLNDKSLDEGQLLELFKLLIEANKRVNEFIIIPLVKKGYFRILEYLKMHNYDLNIIYDDGRCKGNPIFHLIFGYQTNFSFKLSKAIEIGIKCKDEDELGQNILHYWASSGENSILDSILELKLDINKKDFKGFTPLHYLCMINSDNDKIIEKFIDNGADIRIRCGIESFDSGYDPIDFESRSNAWEIRQKFISRYKIDEIEYYDILFEYYKKILDPTGLA